MSELRKAYVYVDDVYAGILLETDNGYSFSYDKTYLSLESPLPVSLTLPLRKEPYESDTISVF